MQTIIGKLVNIIFANNHISFTVDSVNHGQVSLWTNKDNHFNLLDRCSTGKSILAVDYDLNTNKADDIREYR